MFQGPGSGLDVPGPRVRVGCSRAQGTFSNQNIMSVLLFVNVFV